MAKRLLAFLEKFKILYDCQFGFRKGHLTSLALIDNHDRIKDALDSGNSVLGLYIDLKKAFDTVDHDILLAKLEHYGIRGTVKSWFKSYLSQRTQYVALQDEKSSIKTVTTGVPQGSVLGPILFLIYVNDIANSVRIDGTKIMLFADDTNLFITASNVKVLMTKAKESMKQLSEWFRCNKLTLNTDKTQYSIFTRKRAKIAEECDYIEHEGFKIKRVEHAMYLGLALDDKLSWHHHIAMLTSKLVKYASAFKVIGRLVPNQSRKQLYYAYIYSHIQYGIEVFGQTSIKNLKTVQTMQNRILKILFHKDWYTPTDILHKDLCLLKVSDIFKLKVNQFVHKHKLGQLPKVFDSYFTDNTNIHDHNTRQSHNLHLPRTQTQSGQQTIKITGVKLYNALPNIVKSINTIKAFCTKVKKLYYTNY